MTRPVESEGPDGAPVLVLLNSLGTTTAVWDPLVGALAEQFRVLRVEYRGHGGAPAAPVGGHTTIDDLAADVLHVLDGIQRDLGVARVHLAGISLGGMVATRVAISHPARVARLALVCTSAHPGNGAAWLDRAATVRSRGLDTIADSVVSRWITPELAARDPNLLAALRELLTSTDAESYAQCCELLAALDQRADLGRIAAPTLVIAGQTDETMPIEHPRALVEGISGSRLELVAAAHLATVEQPGVVADLLLRHFGGSGTLAAGFRTRRAVLGDEHVDRSAYQATAFTRPFQHLITRYAWADVWSRPELSRRDRSVVTLAALVTLGAEHEFAMHVRGALRNGLTRDEISEVIMHTALYAGLPRANRAFAIAQEVLAGIDAGEPVEER